MSDKPYSPSAADELLTELPTVRSVNVADESPIIVTLRLDAVSSDWFDNLRKQHFPADRNFMRSHLTLFHALPGDQVEAVTSFIGEAADRQPFALDWLGWRSLGRGVAGYLRAPELDAIHGSLSAHFDGWLTRQDSQRLSAHITIQNKAAPEVARATLANVTTVAPTSQIQAVGLEMHRYLGGPWAPLREFAFSRR